MPHTSQNKQPFPNTAPDFTTTTTSLPSNDTTALPYILVSLETRDAASNIFPFMESLSRQSYPLDRVIVKIVDRGSRDDTLDRLAKAKDYLTDRVRDFEIRSLPGSTAGAAHNINFRKPGPATYALVCSPQAILEPSSLTAAICLAQTSQKDVAAWELRQKPSESSKLYSPSSLETSWTSARCALFLISAVKKVNGFEDKALKAGEDVELSYRLRDSGFRLLYAPQATYICRTGSNDGSGPDALPSLEAKLSNLFIRMRYGTAKQRLAIPGLLWQIRFGAVKSKDDHELFNEALRRLSTYGLKFLFSKRYSSRIFPICGWNYELMRPGRTPRRTLGQDITHPLVSIIIRKRHKHSGYLLECIRSVANQSYPNIEMIVVDAGTQAQDEAMLLGRTLSQDIPVRFIASERKSRAFLANAGLDHAKGEFITILDDDNLLFADHIENLVAQLKDQKHALAYTAHMESETELRSRDPFLYLERKSRAAEAPPRSRAHLWASDCIPLSTAMFRRSLFEEHGGLDMELGSAADWDLLVRYSLSTPVANIDRTTVLLRTRKKYRNAGRDRLDAQRKTKETYFERAEKKHKSYQLTLSPCEFLALHRELLERPQVAASSDEED